MEIFNNDKRLRSFRDKFYKVIKYLILRFIFIIFLKNDKFHVVPIIKIQFISANPNVYY